MTGAKAQALVARLECEYRSVLGPHLPGAGRKTAAATDALPDGPVSDKRFILGGVFLKFHKLQQARLLVALWGKGKCPRVSYDRAVRAVYPGEHEDERAERAFAREGSMRAMAKRLDNFLSEKTEGRWTVEDSGAALQLVQIPR